MKYPNGSSPFLNLIGYTPMWEANRRDVVNSVKALVEAGANTQALAGNGYNAYHLCCLSSINPRLSEYLFENVWLDFAARIDTGETAMDLARYYNKQKFLDQIEKAYLKRISCLYDFAKNSENFINWTELHLHLSKENCEPKTLLVSPICVVNSLSLDVSEQS